MRALIVKLMEEKNNAIQQNNKLRQELVRSYDAMLITYAVFKKQKKFFPLIHMKNLCSGD